MIPSKKTKDGTSTEYASGYSQGMEDAITAMVSLLKSNGIDIDPHVFYEEYKYLQDEGIITTEPGTTH